MTTTQLNPSGQLTLLGFHSAGISCICALNTPKFNACNNLHPWYYSDEWWPCLRRLMSSTKGFLFLPANNGWTDIHSLTGIPAKTGNRSEEAEKPGQRERKSHMWPYHHHLTCLACPPLLHIWSGWMGIIMNLFIAIQELGTKKLANQRKLII